VLKATLTMLVLGCVSFAPGCKLKDKAKCDEAIDVTKKSIAAKDFALARQWRERAYSQCGSDDPQATALDNEIVSAEKLVLEEKAKKDAIRAQADALTSLVKTLASQGKADASKIARGATCPDKKEKNEGWCDGTRNVSGQPIPIKIRYWNEEPKALLISTKPAGPASCDALGPNTVVRTFGSTIDGKVAEFKHCNLSGDLSGMQALVGSSETLSFVQVFSAEYLAKDPNLAKRLRGN